MLNLIAMLVVCIFFYLVFPYYQVVIKKKKYDELKFNKINFFNSVIITIICLIIIHNVKLDFKYFSFLPIFSFLANDFLLKNYIDIKADRKTNKLKITFIVILNIISLILYMLLCVLKCFYNKGILDDYVDILEYFASFSSWISFFLLIIESLAIFLLLKYLLKKINKKNFVLYLLLSTFIFFILYDLTILDFRIFAASTSGYGFEALVFKYLIDLFYIYYITIVFINLLLFQNKKVLIYIISLIIFVLTSNITSFHFNDDTYIVHSTCDDDYYCTTNDVFSKSNVYFSYSSDDTEESIGSYGIYYNLPFINSIIWIKDKKVGIYDIYFYENRFVIVLGFGEEYSFEKTDDDYTDS